MRAQRPSPRPALALAVIVFSALCGVLPAKAQQVPATAAPATAAPAPAAPPIRVIIEVPNETLAPALQGGRGAAAPAPAAVAPVAPQPAAPAATAPARVPGVALPGGVKLPAAAPAIPKPPAPTGATAATSSPMGPASSAGAEISAMVAEELDAVRERAKALVEAAPDVPDEIYSASRRFLSMGMGSTSDGLWLLLALVIFVGGGLLARRVAWWSARALLAKILEAPGDTALQRLRLHGMRVTIALYVLTAFVFGSIGAFLLFPWPPVIRETVLIVLAYVVMLALAESVGRVLIAPGAKHDYFRVLPLTQPLARFWFSALKWMVRLVGGAWATLSLLKIIGVSVLARQVIAGCWFTVIAGALLILLVVRLHRVDAPKPSRVGTVLFATLVLLGWLLAALHMRAPFWTLIVLTCLPALMGAIRAGIHNVMRLEDNKDGERSAAVAWSVVVERSLRVLLVLAGASVLAEVWGVDIGDIAMGETLFTRVMRAVLRVAIILLVAELIWRLIRAVIDGRVDGPVQSVHDDTPEGRKRQRLNTLLPILKNFMFAILLTATVLMALDAMGIQIGPLLAGAGVIGIAVGFGAQTLVKDVISGIFYLLDDAFRVGEYIQASNYKGTVESFSLRSVKLRHHRGPLTTVPFGSLGAVQNMSRDWVIDKITVGVTYDTDLDKVKKLVKEIGKELAEDPEFAPHILEPLKMQGVEALSDYAIQIRMKMMTKPGEQFVIRRRAYALLKKAFEANGIKFAFPTVNVTGSGGESELSGAAQQLLEQKAKAAKATADTP